MVGRSGREKRIRVSRARRWCGATAALAVAALAVGAPGAAAQSRAESLVAQMTLDEKLSMVHGTGAWLDPKDLREAGFIPGVPRLGIPPLRLTDAPIGIRIKQPATALPAPIALASSFDARLARTAGRVMGREGRALDQDVLLSPMTNIIRVPQGGRNFETFGEDPLLASEVVAGEVRGIQSAGLIATIKHYAENNQETNRQTINVNVDEQMMQEIELPAFRAAVRAGVGALMCSYNKVNGTYACENDMVLNRILRGQWGFDGWVMSDWGAAHSSPAILTGLDMEMPTGTYFGDPLKSAVQSGSIPASAVDRAVLRILRQMDRFHLLDRTPPARPSVDVRGANRVARRIAEAGAVLLRNHGHVLPLRGRDARYIAVIGATARTPRVDGGGSSHVVPRSATAPLQTIRERAGAARVRYAVGAPMEGAAIPASALSPALPLDASGAFVTPMREQRQYTSTLTVPETGNYWLRFETQHGYGTLQVDGGPIVTAGRTTNGVYLHLTAGAHTLAITTRADRTDDELYRLTWITPRMATAALDDAVALAKRARTAVVFAFDDNTEGDDRRSLRLPGNQEALIRAVAEVNPRTVVVLNTGSSVVMPWRSRVEGILDAWYPGQAGAEATTRLLFGHVDPSGRLAETFPARESQTPVAGDPRRYPGVDGQQDYSEGIFVGYRWFDRRHVRPAYPFGFGLSYTHFAYSGLSVARARDGGLVVTVRVRNAGRRAGRAVPQVYIGPSPRVAQRQPVRALAGFTKLLVPGGASRTVRIHVNRRRLEHWDTARDRWILGRGTRAVWVGASAADLPLRARVQIG